MEYDSFTHHVTFRPVFASVVGSYRAGGYVGILASKWRNTDNFKTWEFEIRPGLTFENGDPITPEVILKSWNRVAYLMKIADSKSGLFEFLKGFDQIKSASDRPEGMSATNSSVRLEFSRAIPDLIEKIGFGLYAVVHPSQFDGSSGAWLDERKAISSSGYKITHWDNELFTLELRPEFPKELLHPHPINRVNIQFVRNLETVHASELVIAPSYDLSLDNNFEFQGPVNANIVYAICVGWQDNSRICGDLSRRRQLRTAFYRGLAKANFSPTRSFLPLSVNGSRELVDLNQDELRLKLENPNLKIPKLNFGLKSESNRNRYTLNESIHLATVELVKGYQLELEELDLDDLRVGEEPPIDLDFRITGILVEQPREDLKFMFLSKQGINLPDTDGRITAELQKEDFDPQKINELIWDQAVVWPMMHFSQGIWVRKDSNLDLSLINLTLPPTDFQWLGWKE